MSRLIAVALVAGCGRLGFDASVVADAGNDGDAPVTCELGKWATPVRLDGLSMAATRDFGPAISADGLTLYFDSDRAGDGDIYVAQRASLTDDFGPPVHVDELATTSTEADAALSDDELELFFDSARGSTGFCIYRSTRTDKGQPWGPVQIQDQLCNATEAGGPALSSDGLTLYYTQHTDSDSEGEILVSTRPTRSARFPHGVSIPALVGGANKGYPTIRSDGLELIYEQRAAQGNALELWRVTRATTAEAFGPPSRIDELDADIASGDEDPSLDGSGTILVFASGRDTGSPDLYITTRACP